MYMYIDMDIYYLYIYTYIYIYIYIHAYMQRRAYWCTMNIGYHVQRARSLECWNDVIYSKFSPLFFFQLSLSLSMYVCMYVYVIVIVSYSAEETKFRLSQGSYLSYANVPAALLYAWFA